MKIASIADVKAKLSAFVKASGKSPVVITRNGKAVAAIISLGAEEDLDRLMLGYSPRLREILAAARGRIRNGEGISHEEFWSDAAPRRKLKRRPA